MKKITTLVIGASGATGQLLVAQLIKQGQAVRVIVREKNALHESIRNHDELSVIQASILDLSDAEMIQHVKGCDAIASCLGHNMSFKGIYGQPRRLVTDATRRLCAAIKSTAPERPVKFVLMNTTGNSNRDLNESVSMSQKGVLRLLRLMLPPHVDNENAADFLRTEIAKDDRQIEWAAVRPDTLIDEVELSDFEVHASPTRSAIFDAGTTSRINVACFMSDLITDHDLWASWKGKMPVIYNKDPSSQSSI